MRETPTPGAQSSSLQLLDPAFYLSGVQAQAIATVLNFIDAYNAGRLQDALGLLDDRHFGQVTDCDFRKGMVRTFTGKPEAMEWLRARTADHDQLQLAAVSAKVAAGPAELRIDLVDRTDTPDPPGSRQRRAAPTPVRAVLTADGDRLVELKFAVTSAQCRSDRVLDVPSPGAPAFRLGAIWARQVATIMNFVGAYNARNLNAALALLDDDLPSVSDCNYREGTGIRHNGKSGAAVWLQERFDDHDGITLGTVWKSGGSAPMEVGWAKRTSDTLRSLGFADGIRPVLATKVQFSSEGRRLGTFFLSRAHETGEAREECRPAGST